jgi:uncharacterized protein
MDWYWPWWAGGLALASVALGHWFLAERQLAVSGRFTGIVNRLRHGPLDRTIETVGHDDLVAALRAATAVEFGTGALEAVLGPGPQAPDDLCSPAGGAVAPAPRVENEGPSQALVKKRLTALDHVAFLVALAAGGLLAQLTASERPPSMALLQSAFANRPWVIPLLFGVGGLFVGFGTRMAGGCTSGHGLCGVSRFQKGSLLATAMFFGCGVVASFAMKVFL